MVAGDCYPAVLGPLVSVPIVGSFGPSTSSSRASIVRSLGLTNLEVGESSLS